MQLKLLKTKKLMIFIKTFIKKEVKMNEVAPCNQRSSLSRAALICGICGFIPAVGLAAIICAIIDLVKIKKIMSLVLLVKVGILQELYYRFYGGFFG